MANEAECVVNNYLNYNEKGSFFMVESFGVGASRRKILLQNWNSFERPDIYSKHNDKVYGIEHFEYDARRRNKNGSLQRRENEEIKKSVDEEIKEKFKTQNSVVSFRELKSKANEQDYKANFAQSFKSHYSKIDEYKKHLSEALGVPENNISIWFMAEDMTMLGSHFICCNKPKQGDEPAFPLYLQEIEELFLKSKKLEGIIFANHYSKVLTMVRRNKKAIEKLKECHCYRNEPLSFFEPKIASTATKILI